MPASKSEVMLGHAVAVTLLTSSFSFQFHCQVSGGFRKMMLKTFHELSYIQIVDAAPGAVLRRSWARVRAPDAQSRRQADGP